MSGILVDVTIDDLVGKRRSVGDSSYYRVERAPEFKLSSFVRNVQRELPVEYVALRDAWTRFWYALGTQDICNRCFARNLTPEEKEINRFDGGCCGGCVLSTTTGCAQKPVACAAWHCGLLGSIVRKQGEAFKATFDCLSYAHFAQWYREEYTHGVDDRFDKSVKGSPSIDLGIRVDALESLPEWTPELALKCRVLVRCLEAMQSLILVS